mgnify:CR=1 FL=1
MEFKVFKNNYTVVVIKLKQDGQKVDYRINTEELESLKVMYNILGGLLDEAQKIKDENVEEQVGE